MAGFRVRNYEVHTHRIPQDMGLKIALIADLHGVCHGEGSGILLKAVRQGKPDLVVCAGDMITRRNMASLETARDLLTKLAGEYPVAAGSGNHETATLCPRPKDEGLEISGLMKAEYLRCEQALREKGVILLHNGQAELEIRGCPVEITGLELPLDYFKRGFPPPLSLADMTAMAGSPSETGLRLLIAHNPRYAPVYFEWGADLIFSGHYHGGVMRLGERVCLITPQLELFPEYGCGDFHKGEQHMFVSPGLGEHSMPFRIHNPRELVIITVNPAGNMR